MSIFDDHLSKINRLIQYAPIAARLVLIENAAFIEDLNREQLSQGERSDGSILPPYAPVSVAMGKPPGPIRLFDEGDFYEGINLSVFDDKMVFTGEDEKTPMLIERYGQMILGLSDESIETLLNYIKPQILRKLQEFKDRL